MNEKLDSKTLADVQPGGRVRLGDQAERARFEAWAEPRKHTLTRWGDSPGDVKPLFVSEVPGNYISPAAQAAWEAWQHLSAQPSPGGQGELAALVSKWRNEASAYDDQQAKETGFEVDWTYDAKARALDRAADELEAALAASQPVRSSTVSDDMMDVVDRLGSEHDEVDPRAWDHMLIYAPTEKLAARLAARQPVGELHLPPDGFYKIVFDDAEVPDESFARSGALDAALRRFEQISNKWNAHLFVRFANNTRDCTVPNATPAQAVDLGPVIEEAIGCFNAAEFEGWHDALAEGDIERIRDLWNRRIEFAYRALIDSQVVSNG